MVKESLNVDLCQEGEKENLTVRLDREEPSCEIEALEPGWAQGKGDVDSDGKDGKKVAATVNLEEDSDSKGWLTVVSLLVLRNRSKPRNCENQQ